MRIAQEVRDAGVAIADHTVRALVTEFAKRGVIADLIMPLVGRVLG